MRLTAAAVAILIVCTPAMWASEKLVGPASNAEVGPGYAPCPSALADVIIDRVDAETGRLYYTTKGLDGWLKADQNTRFRIPGVDRKSSGLERVESGHAARIRYCTDDGTLQWVKVLRKKIS